MTTTIHRIKSFAFANAKLANPNITMDMIDQCFDEACVKASIFLHQHLSGRSSVSKPVAGQWYELDGKRMYCIGLKTNGRAYMEHDNENFEVLTEQRQRYLTHLPDCTGWDWEEETFPQYWTSPNSEFAFIRANSKTDWFWVHKNGSEVHCVDRVSLTTKITEQEALALLDKPQRAEDPEEWVEITDPEHVLRAGVDQYYSNALREWSAIADSHGYKWCKSCLRSYRVRCRRKDLPAKKRTITVPKWLCFAPSTGWWVVEQEKEPSSYNAVHRVGETTYEIPE